MRFLPVFSYFQVAGGVEVVKACNKLAAKHPWALIVKTQGPPATFCLCALFDWLFRFRLSS